MTYISLTTIKLAPVLIAMGALAACETVIAGADADGLATPVETVSVPATGEGIFFPPVTSTDTPQIRFNQTLPVGAMERTFFSDQINLATTSGERMVPIVIQAVGDDQKTLVFVALESSDPMTPYIARAMLARMTSVMRFAPALTEMGINQDMDIYNMAAILGFDRVVVSDGRSRSHMANIIRPE